MTQMTTPLILSAAGFRVAGYILEKNLRVAQEFGRAAMLTNPFVVGMRVKYSAPVAKPQVVKSAPVATPKVAKKAETTQRKAVAAATPATKAKPATEKTEAAAPAPVASKPA
jgi:hypothetical protein